MRKQSVTVVLGLLAGFVAGCAGTPSPLPSATLDITAEARGTVTRRAEEANSTETAATAAAKLGATSDAAATQAQGTAEAENRAATREAAIEQAKLESTSVANNMLDMIEQLRADGYLTSTEGTYGALEDFDQSWAQINWYQWWYTGLSPTDFVIVADAEWDSASDRANWWASGCGFVFRENGAPNHYLAYLGLDGYVYFSRNVGGVQAQLGSSYFGTVGTPSGQARIMLVAEGTNLTFFVNGERVHSRQDRGLATGQLALTLLSGINAGFGTRCQMTNIELWELD